MVLLMETVASHRACTSTSASLGRETCRYSVPMSYTGCASLPAPEVKGRMIKSTGRCQGALPGSTRQRKVLQNLSSTYPTPLSMTAE